MREISRRGVLQLDAQTRRVNPSDWSEQNWDRPAAARLWHAQARPQRGSHPSQSSTVIRNKNLRDTKAVINKSNVFLPNRVRATQETRQSFSSLPMCGSVRYGWGPTRRCILKTHKYVSPNVKNAGENLCYFSGIVGENRINLWKQASLSPDWLLRVISSSKLIIQRSLFTQGARKVRGSWGQTQRAILFVLPSSSPSSSPSSTEHLQFWSISEHLYVNYPLEMCSPCRTTLCVAVSASRL